LRGNDLHRPDVRSVHIAEGVNVIERVYKAPGGLIRATAVEENGCLRSVHFSGDFFIYPASALRLMESTLEGASARSEMVAACIDSFYSNGQVQSPGVTASDFAVALVGEGIPVR
jgi:lipoate-protein ligase A